MQKTMIEKEIEYKEFKTFIEEVLQIEAPGEQPRAAAIAVNTWLRMTRGINPDPVLGGAPVRIIIKTSNYGPGL